MNVIVDVDMVVVVFSTVIRFRVSEFEFPSPMDDIEIDIKMEVILPSPENRTGRDIDGGRV